MKCFLILLHLWNSGHQERFLGWILTSSNTFFIWRSTHSGALGIWYEWSSQCLNQCSSGIIFFRYHSGTYNEGSQSLIPLEYWYLKVFFYFILYHLGLYTMQETWYLGKLVLVSMWFRMKLTQMITWAHKDSLAFSCPPDNNIWLVLQFW